MMPIVGLDICASCGADIRRTKNHHCTESHERAREHAQQRKSPERQRSYYDRMQEGCDMLEREDD